MIKSKDILGMINTLSEALPYAKCESQLAMRVAAIRDCGSPHCHGGWYAIACGYRDRVDGYWIGAKRMAEDLGFRVHGDVFSQAIEGLRLYMACNPDIWGNDSGTLMFSYREAFKHPEKRPNGAFTLQDIVDHWKEVYERVKAIEDRENPKHMDITKELAVLPVEETPDVKEVNQLVHQK